MGLLRAAARTAVIAGTATAVSSNVQRRQVEKHPEFYGTPAGQAPQQAFAAAPVNQVAPAPVSDTSNQLAEIEKLGELKAKGLLTEEEFAAKKAQILGL